MKPFSCLFVFIAAAGCASFDTGPEPPRLAPRAVHDRLEAGEPVLLVCAYPASKCSGAHLAGSLSLEEFEKRPTAETQGREIVFYCGCPGQESALNQAVYYRSLGWTRTAVLEGGIPGWLREGLPLVAGTTPDDDWARSEIPWSDDLEGAKRLSAKSGKPLVVCYVADWCEVCRRFRKRTLRASELNGLVDRFLWVAIHVDRDFAAIRNHAIEGTPTTDFIDPWGATRARLSGFVRAEPFRRLLEDFENEVKAGPIDPTLFSRREIQSAKGEAVTGLPQGYRGSGICYLNVGYGPVRLPSMSPFQSLRFGLAPRTPSTLADGGFEVRWTESWANLWARDAAEHIVDFETLQSELTVAYGLSDVVQVELGFVQKSRFGGVMDGFIQGFHDLFGLAQGGRDKTSKNDFALEIDREDGTPAALLTNEDRGSFSESVVATIQHNITCGTRSYPALAYALTARRELGDQENMSGAQSVDLSASVSASKNFGDWFGYLSLGYSWYGRERFEDVELRTTQVSALFALELQVFKSSSLILQYLVSQGVAKDLREFSRPSYELTLGFKVEVAPGTLLELGLIENTVTFDNSPDFGFHAGLLRRF